MNACIKSDLGQQLSGLVSDIGDRLVVLFGCSSNKMLKLIYIPSKGFKMIL